jgi:hypothetical protein
MDFSGGIRAMLRKTKIPSPFFKLGNPHDPVTGAWGPLMLNAPYCRFVLTEALTTAMASAHADITNQYGYGGRHSYHDSIVVLNCETAVSSGVYKFSGAINDAGIAVWDNCQKWLIVSLNAASGLKGGCLDENHPGRGVVFHIHLGTWDSVGASPHWNYDLTTTVHAIDWRYGVPYPDAGATGLFEARSSDTYGTIYETVALDCSSPGACA